MTDRELMQQALESLEFEAEGWECVPPITREAIAALRERLAQPEQEPLAWANLNELTEQFNSVNCGTVYRLPGEGRSPLYTTPPQRKPLIAAAPDLLEALQGLLKGIFDGPDEANAAMLVAKARDAVNKATGEK